MELGILHDRDTRLAEKLITSFPGVDARLNEPYGPEDGVLHTLNVHAAPRRLRARHDRDPQRSHRRTNVDRHEWAERLCASLDSGSAH